MLRGVAPAVIALAAVTAGCTAAAGSQHGAPTVRTQPMTGSAQRSATPIAMPPPPPGSRRHRHLSRGGPAEPTSITLGRRHHQILSAPVDPIDASVGSGIDPPVWGRAVFWTGSHEPASPAQGTTLVYAHACTHHVCPFTDLHRARPGDPVFLGSATGRFRYRVVRIVSLPKVDLARFGFSGYDLALITCELPGEGSESDNRMVLAVLTGFRPARS